MPKAHHRLIRPKRIEVAQFIGVLAVIKYSDLDPLPTFADADPGWLDREICFNASRRRLFDFLDRRMKRGRAKGSRALGNPSHPINLELPIESLRFAACYLEGHGFSDLGDRRLQTLLIKGAPKAWLFASRCNKSASARPGQPTSSYSQMLKRLPNVCDRQARRLTALLHAMDQRPSCLVTGLLAGTNPPNTCPQG